MSKHILLLVLIAPLILAQTPPVFPEQYELSFSEKASIGVISGNTTGKIYYDSTNNRQVITRANGRYDRYCGTVYKLVNTPCNHHIV